MPNTIQLKRSSTAAAVPSAGVLSLGELAVNTVDEKIFFKNSTGTVKALSATADLVDNLVTIATTQTVNGLKTFSDEVTINSRIVLDDGNSNIIVGDGMPLGTYGSQNVSIGAQALTDIITGTDNTAIGFRALKDTTDGYANVAIGALAAKGCTIGYDNTAIGGSALVSITEGISNTAIGSISLSGITVDTNNTAIGSASLGGITAGSSNTAIGTSAGYFRGSGNNVLDSVDNSIFIGELSRASADGTTNQIVIGYNALGIGSNTVTIGRSTNVANRFYGVISTGAAAPTIASAATIAPTQPITFISGTTQINTITAPTGISTSGGQITLIPTGLFTTGTSGNIALATTAVVNRALIMTYDSTTTKWYPSY